jgi:hypothetical protein
LSTENPKIPPPIGQVRLARSDVRAAEGAADASGR